MRQQRQPSIQTLQQGRVFPPEVKLALSVIRQAQLDANSKAPARAKAREEARHFFASEGYVYWLDVVACYLPVGEGLLPTGVELTE